jgi:replicative DNA helicase
MSLVSLQLERHTLNGIINNPSVFPEVERFLSENCFTSKVHSVIFSCIKSLLLDNKQLDKVLIAQSIKNLGISFAEDLDIFSYVESICFSPITLEATIEASKELIKLKVLRDLEETCHKIENHVNKSANQDLTKTILEVDALYGENINQLDNSSKPENLYDGLLEMIEERGNNPIDDIGLITPFKEYNRLYGGLRGGNIYAIASRPKQGKTTMLSYWASKMGEIHNIPILFLDTEMSSEEQRFRTASSVSGVPTWFLETGNWRKNEEYVYKVRTTLKFFKNKVFHYYVGNKPVDEVCSIIRRWHLSNVGRGGKCIVVYDYLKLTGEKLSGFHQEHHAIGEKVDKFRSLSVELDFPFLTAIQLNRSGENRGKQSSDITDDGSAVATSDRLQWFTSYLGIFRRRTEDEMLLDTLESGSHKLIEIATRFQGRDAQGHIDFIKRTFPDGKTRYLPNFLNFNVSNFSVEERGSLKDCIIRQNSSFKAVDKEKKGDIILE